MQHRVVTAVLVFIMTIALSGCLVEKKAPKKYSRTTDNLHIYQPNEYIIYNVIATQLSGTTQQTLYGTLRVEYQSLPIPLIRPGTTTSIPALREVTTLSFNNGGTSDAGTVRYISQDVNGQITLHALESGSDHYWLNSASTSGSTTTESFPVFFSPLSSFGLQPHIQFYVLEGCEGGGGICGDSVGQFYDDLDIVGDSTEVSTNLGIFINPFQINFSGGATALDGNPFPVTFDIRDVCGTQTVTHGSGGNGTMYVMPEIGVIKMSNSCYDPIEQETVHYSITLSNTNIALP